MTQVPGQYSSDLTIQFLHNLGISGTDVTSVDPTALQAVEDAIDAQHAGDISVLDGFNFKNVASISDFTRALGWAEQFAAVTGYRYFPTMQRIASMANPYWVGKRGGFDKQKAFEDFYNAMPADAKSSMPYAKLGMTNEDYTTAAASFVDRVEQYTGNRNVDPTLVQQAVGEHWSTDRFMNALTKNSQFNAQYGWVKYGKTYQDWLNLKIQNAQEVQARYGVPAATGANADQYFLQNLQNPLQRQSASASSGQQPIGPMQTSQAAQFVRSVDPSHAAAVR